MGTRADFYLGTDPKTMRWLGSIAWDGDPEGVPSPIFQTTTEEEYVKAVQKILSEEEDATTPDMGWPWPWEDSRTTDYAYTFENGEPLVSAGKKFVTLEEFDFEFEPLLPTQKFPDMTNVQRVTYGPRSGLLVISKRKE